MKNKGGDTLLHWAAAGKKYDVVHFLLSAGAEANTANSNGWDSLLCALVPTRAIYKPHSVVETATLLLEHDADPLVCSAEGLTPLHCLAMHPDTEKDSLLAKLATNLVARGAPINTGTAGWVPVSEPYICSRPRLDTLDVGPWGSRLARQRFACEYCKGRTPLHFAERYSAVGTAGVLEAHGADTQAKDANGNQPVDLRRS